MHTQKILDDDLQPKATCTPSSQNVNEGSGAVISIDLAAVSGKDITIPLTYSGTATNGVDYTGFSSKTITAGNTGVFLILSTALDPVAEPTETIIVSCGGAATDHRGIPTKVTVNINNINP